MKRTPWLKILVVVALVAAGLAAGYRWAPIASGVRCPIGADGQVDLTRCSSTYVPLSVGVKCVPSSQAPAYVDPSANPAGASLNPSTDLIPPQGKTSCRD